MNKSAKKKASKVVCFMLTLVLTLSNLVGLKLVNVSAATDQETNQQMKRVIGYLPSYRMETVDSIDFSALTHVNLSFMTYKDGTLTSGFSDEDVQKIKAKCEAANVKVLIAIGGGGGFDTSDKPFETAKKRTNVINQIMTYVDKFDLDGVDIDIEVSDTDGIWVNFEKFIAELSGRLKAEDKLLTTAVSGWFTSKITEKTYTYFDFVNLMTYDEHAGDGDLASMDCVLDMIKLFLGKGISKDRMTIGVPFYGYGKGGWGDAYTYAEILAKNPDAKYKNYCEGIYYNGEAAIRAKAELSKEYGGIMIWELGQDSFDDNSLLKVIKDVYQSGAQSQKNKVVGYFPSYRTEVMDSVDYSAITHMNLAFMTYKDGTMTSNFEDEDVKKLKEKCAAQNVKVLIAIGGGGGFDTSDKPFETAAKRTKVINQIMTYVNKFNLDGVDVDIEVGSDDPMWANFEDFIIELSGRLKKENKLLTTAVSSWFTDSITLDTYMYYDFINLMTYDEHAGDGDLASMGCVESIVNYFYERGITKDRMTIGVPFYGYGAGGWGDAYTYAQILEKNPDAKHLDYCEGIYYNGEDTIRQKAEYSKQYGGIMIWELGQDSFDENSLLQVIKETVAPTPALSAEEAALEKVSVSKDKITLYTGKKNHTATLKVSLPEEIEKDAVVTYEASNESIATVSKNGKITAKSTGIIDIRTTVSVGDTKKVYTTEVTVKDPYIAITSTKTTVKAGSKLTMKAKLYGENGKITWKSSNKKVAKIDAKTGKITAIKKGTVTITASYDGITEKIKVQVK